MRCPRTDSGSASKSTLPSATASEKWTTSCVIPFFTIDLLSWICLCRKADRPPRLNSARVLQPARGIAARVLQSNQLAEAGLDQDFGASPPGRALCFAVVG